MFARETIDSHNMQARVEMALAVAMVRAPWAHVVDGGITA